MKRRRLIGRIALGIAFGVPALVFVTAFGLWPGMDQMGTDAMTIAAGIAISVAVVAFLAAREFGDLDL